MSTLIHKDTDYKVWIENLSLRYRNCQTGAMRSVNEHLLRFYWTLGEEIQKMNAERRWGSKVIPMIGEDLQDKLPDTHCFSRTNLFYIKKFYLLYSQLDIIVPQLGGQFEDLFSIPWGHHKIIMDKVKNDPVIDRELP